MERNDVIVTLCIAPRRHYCFTYFNLTHMMLTAFQGGRGGEDERLGREGSGRREEPQAAVVVRRGTAVRSHRHHNHRQVVHTVLLAICPCGTYTGKQTALDQKSRRD